MRLEADHVAKLQSAIVRGKGGHVDLDVGYLSSCMRRLTLWESGLLVDSLMRAAAAKRLTKEQRVLLALFVSAAPTESEAGDAS